MNAAAANNNSNLRI